MATESTASSGTDAPEPTESSDTEESNGAPAAAPAEQQAAAPRAAPQADVARRAFFKEFGRQAVTTVGQVAGMANIVSRTSTSAAVNLLGLDEETLTGRPARTPAARPRRERATTRKTISTGTDVEDTFRSPYRLEGDDLILLDQRVIPEALEELTCRRGSDVAYHLRTGAIRGGPVMAQVAAYGLAATARERQAKPAEAREAELRRTRNALATARLSARLPTWAMERMDVVRDELADDVSGEVIADALRAEADAIAQRFSSDHVAIAGHLIEALPVPADRPLQVIVHGAPGALAGGQFGTTLSALAQIAEGGRNVLVYLTEARPFMEGARLANWELRQLGVEHRVVPDAAVAWLLSRETIDAVLLTPDWITADGSTVALIGSLAVATQARAIDPPIGTDRPQVIACGSSAVVDLATADTSEMQAEMRPTREINSYLEGVNIGTTEAMVPAVDVLAPGAIDVLITEHGPVRPFTPARLRELADPIVGPVS